MTLSIVIPCLNERKTILSVLRDARHHANKFLGKDFEIIVSDNGSTDGSQKAIKKVKGIRLINVPVRGYGAALHWGIMSSKAKYSLIADADMSYPFSNLIRFKNQIRENPDLVLGSRLRGKIEKGAMPFLHRYFGTPLLTVLIRVIYGIDTSDCNSGMRLIRNNFYKSLNMRNSGMEWASEMLLKTALKKGKYLEVPIDFKKDNRSRKPHLATWADGWRHLKSIFLLKTQTLNWGVGVFIAIGVVFYKKSFALSFLSFSLSFILFLSILTLQLLKMVIDKQENKVSSFLIQFRLVPLCILSTLIIGISIMFIPDNRLGTKLFLANAIGIVFMWMFLVETIKTHLINKLSD